MAQKEGISRHQLKRKTKEGGRPMKRLGEEQRPACREGNQGGHSSHPENLVTPSAQLQPLRHRQGTLRARLASVSNGKDQKNKES